MINVSLAGRGSVVVFACILIWQKPWCWCFLRCCVYEGSLKFFIVIISIKLSLFLSVLMTLTPFQCHGRVWTRVSWVFVLVVIKGHCVCFLFIWGLLCVCVCVFFWGGYLDNEEINKFCILFKTPWEWRANNFWKAKVWKRMVQKEI